MFRVWCIRGLTFNVGRIYMKPTCDLETRKFAFSISVVNNFICYPFLRIFTRRHWLGINKLSRLWTVSDIISACGLCVGIYFILKIQTLYLHIYNYYAQIPDNRVTYVWFINCKSIYALKGKYYYIVN